MAHAGRRGRATARRRGWGRRCWRLVELVVVPLAILAVAPATWWVSTPVIGRASGDDRMFVPPGWLVVVEHAVGASAVMLVAAGVRMFVAQVEAGVLRRGWLQVLAPVGAAFAYFGATYRIAITPVSGANIGGGVLILGIGPVILACSIAAMVGLLELRRGAPTDHGRRHRAERSGT